ncbi:Panacea domain-containing protein [Clostridium perfringens]|uniref:Panacea domain-containing protein n=1 Tax=Clostridium perfringens TaxID=1502 RepID=UPI0030D19C0B
MTYSALDISRFVINYAIKKETPISNLLLQKILYYIQANFLVNKGEKCFNEEIINWEYGPVVIEVYDEFRSYGRNKIEDEQTSYEKISFDSEKMELKVMKKEYNDSIIDEKSKKNIIEVVDNYTIKKYIDNPFNLVKKTHSEDPWKNSARNDVIEIEDIKRYYSKNNNKIFN